MKLPGVFDMKVLDNGTVALTQRPSEHMTGDELAARLFAEQGYLVLAGNELKKIGDLVIGADSKFGWSATPVRIVAISNIREFMEQDRLATRIFGGISSETEHRYFYRVEALD